MGLTRPIWRISPDGERVWFPSMAAAAKETNYAPAGFHTTLMKNGMKAGIYRFEFDEAAPRVHITKSKPPTLPFLLREAADLLEQAEKEAQLRAKREMEEKT